MRAFLRNFIPMACWGTVLYFILYPRLTWPIAVFTVFALDMCRAVWESRRKEPVKS